MYNLRLEGKYSLPLPYKTSLSPFSIKNFEIKLLGVNLAYVSLELGVGIRLSLFFILFKIRTK